MNLRKVNHVVMGLMYDSTEFDIYSVVMGNYKDFKQEAT